MSIDIYFYRIKEIQENKNMLIENLGTLLTNSFQYKFTSFQPISIQPDIAIRVPLHEILQSDKSNFINYVRIAKTNGDYFYFVRSIKRLANETLEFNLHIDVLNSFDDYIRQMSDKTLTIREHRDRYESTFTSITFPYTTNLFYIVDDISEGINPSLYKSTYKFIYDNKNDLTKSFYLIYKTRYDLTDTEASNPVECYLCGDSQIKVNPTGSSTAWNVSNLSAGTVYYAIRESAGPFSISVTNPNETFTYNDTGIVMFQKATNNTQIRVTDFKASQTSKPYYYDTITNENHYSITFNTCYKLKTLSYMTNDTQKILSGNDLNINAGSSSIYLLPYSSVSNWDSKLIKIIKIPYAPNAVTKNSSTGIYDFGSNWTYDNGLLKLNDLHTTFSNFFGTGVKVPVSESNVTFQSINSLRFLKDPKLMHSDFHIDKWSFDSFNFSIPLEKVRWQDFGLSEQTYGVTFKPTNTINSNLMFTIEFDETYLDFTSSNDYDVLLSTRNSEMPIFNNSYINYIKNGYNYDKKSKAIQSASNWSNVAISGVGTLLGALMAANPATAPLGAMATVGSAVSLVNSAKNAITTDIQNENGMQSKLATLKAQATAVAGTDDIDLMSSYALNKLKFISYDPTDKIKQMLDDYFYYFGYKTNVYKVPNFNSRVRFNFIQCEPQFKANDIAGQTPPTEFVDEIIEKCKNGFTVYHANTVNGVVTIDWNQEYENYESFMI